jgi:hypothetical protein
MAGARDRAAIIHNMGRQVIRTVMQLYGEVTKETLVPITKPTAWAAKYCEVSERTGSKNPRTDKLLFSGKTS